MPTIFTRESEQASSLSASATQTNVLVPLIFRIQSTTSAGAIDLPDSEVTKLKGPNFFEGSSAGKSAFIALYETPYESSEGSIDTRVTAEFTSREMIKGLINAGIGVWVKGLASVSDVNSELDVEAQGSVTKGAVSIINEAVEGSSETSPLFEEFAARNLYNIKYITTGAHANRYAKLVDTSDGSKQPALTGCWSTLIALAEERTDCIAIIEGPEAYELSYLSGSVQHNYGFKDLITGIYSSPIASTYAHVPLPWITTSIVKDNVIKYLPGGYGYLLANANAGNDCFATAGVERGLIPGLTSVKYDIGEGLMHQLNGDEKLDGSYYQQNCLMNPIYYTGSRGYRIWGANTAVTTADKNKWSSFLNIRVTACNIKKQLYEIAAGLLFSPNDDITYSNFLMRANSYLNTLVANRGIASYTWYRLPSDKKATIKVKLVIQPIEPVTCFDIELNLSEDTTEMV